MLCRYVFVNLFTHTNLYHLLPRCQLLVYRETSHRVILPSYLLIPPSGCTAASAVASYLLQIITHDHSQSSEMTEASLLALVYLFAW